MIRNALLAVLLLAAPIAVHAQTPAEIEKARIEYNAVVPLLNAKRYEEALPAVKRAADLGLSNAQAMMGVMASNGYAMPQSKLSARFWFEKSAAQGNANATFNLALLYDKGEGVAQSFEKALDYYKRAADLGDAPAAYNAGHMYLKGQGAPVSLEDAFSYFQIAAEAGLAPGQNAVGFSYRNGFGVKMDWLSARYWFIKAADQGDETAVRNLKNMAMLSFAAAHENEKNGRTAEASLMYSWGCKYGYFNACVDDGRAAYYGIGRAKNFEVARVSYGKACFEGIDVACRGHAYAVVKNPVSADEIKRAATWLQAACNARTDTHACNTLAYMKYTPEFGMYDPQGAKKLLVDDCFNRGYQPSCQPAMAIMNAENASRPVRKPPGLLESLILDLAEGVAEGATVASQAYSAGGGYSGSSGGGSSSSSAPSTSSAQDARNFDQFISSVNSIGTGYYSPCRSSNPYC